METLVNMTHTSKETTMRTAQDVINADMDYICHEAAESLTKMKGKRLLLTGGAGFLGYYLTLAILHWNRKQKTEDKVSIFLLDNFIRGVPGWIELIEKEPDSNVQTHDITEPLPQNIDTVSYIIHAASIASPTYYRIYPIETMDANINGLRYLLDYCKSRSGTSQKVNGFLFFSSSEIYGNPTPENIPTPETYYGYVSCTGPRACYDESKRYGETLCVNFARQHGIPITIARPFNNYGPGLKITDKRAIADFAGNIFDDKDMVLLSDGLATRTFCYVADAIAGYFKVLTHGSPGASYNIGVESPEISMRDFAELVRKTGNDLFSYSGKVIFEKSSDKDYLSDNPQRRCPDISKARKDLGYSPSISLEEGVKRSLIWYSDNRTEVEG